jgi:hypothetical protein
MPMRAGYHMVRQRLAAAVRELLPAAGFPEML